MTHKAPEQPASPTLREALERLRRDSERASAGPWLYEADDEGWSMGWIGNMVPAGRGQVFNSLFAVEGDSAQQAINAEFAADCVNFVRDALSRPAEPAQDDAAVDVASWVQGEVTEAISDDDIVDIANIVTDLADADALDMVFPELRARLEAIVLRAMQAAAPKEERG